jgi:hypothetical protein
VHLSRLLRGHECANRLENQLGYFRGILIAINSHSNIGKATFDGFHIGMKLFQSYFHLFFRIIGSLLQSGAHGVILRRREGHVIDLSRDGIRPTAHDSFHQYFIGYVEENEAVGGDAGPFQGLCLFLRARKAIEQPTLRATIVLIESVFDL